MKSIFIILSGVFFLVPQFAASKFSQMKIADGDEIEFDVVDQKCFKSSYDIHTSGDLLQISDCPVISGSIIINDYNSEFMDLGHINEIKGDLTVSNVSSIQRIQGLQLEMIGGAFQFDTLTSLTNLAFPKLQSVETLRWHVLPILTSVNFNAGIKDIKSVIMSDTSLTGFGGFNVETLRNLNINNNRFLERIESSVKEITGELSISANAENLQVVLPQLTKVKSLTLRDAEDVRFDSLQIVEQNADFINNQFSSLKLPKLKSTGQTLSIINNENLGELDFNSLTEIGGGLMVIDNERVNMIEFFANLKSVGGAIELQGDISQCKFNEIKIVKGSAIMKSSSNELDCTEWMSSEIAKAVRGGKIECSAGDKPKEIKLVDDRGKTTKETTEPSTSGGLFNHKDSSAGWAIKASLLSVVCSFAFAVFWNMF